MDIKAKEMKIKPSELGYCSFRRIKMTASTKNTAAMTKQMIAPIV